MARRFAPVSRCDTPNLIVAKRARPAVGQLRPVANDRSREGYRKMMHVAKAGENIDRR